NEKQTAQLVQDILEVFAFVHKQNVIHRDIKPSNIMRRKQDGKLVLIDFGSVKVLSALVINSQGMTDVTIGVGSPGYMPSEQARGKPKLASDVYAVGIIGIQALTGLAPQQFPEDSSTGEIVWRNLVSVNSELANVLDKMTRDHFSLRYQNASQALEALTPTQITFKPQPSSSNNNKKSFLPVLIGMIIMLFGVGLAGYKLLSTSKSTYFDLENSLKEQKWQEADSITANLMLQAGDLDDNEWLELGEISNFSCLEIKKIDLLWQNYSKGKFGFNVQKKIYLETGNDLGDYNEKTYKEFGKQIGWFNNNQWSDYEIIFAFNNIDNAQLGRLPLGRRLINEQLATVWSNNNGKARSQWFLRAKQCQVTSDFAQLENLLQTRQWQEADRKTAELMLELSDRQQHKWIDLKAMNKVDCQYISDVDKLWLKYSQGKFGFSVQRSIWDKIKSANNPNPALAFGTTVGWFNGSRWLSSYDLNYELEEAPEGYFPSVSRAGNLSSGWTGYPLIISLSEKSQCLDLKSEEN
ncbi:MAG: GUN4 domain-containing protein, partial [Cyanobacteria bacterium J06621_12]